MVCLLATGSGCTSISPFGRPLPESEVSAAASADQPSYKVILVGGTGSEPHIYRGAINGNVTVQDALKASGAIDRFDYMSVDLARRVPDKAEILRLEINYDAEEQEVVAEWNYAVHDGDEILVRKESGGAVTRFFEQIGGIEN